MNREIIFFENHFMDFYLQLSPKAQEKVDFVLKMIATVEKVPEKFLKHLSGTDGLFEIRVEYQGKGCRIFCCFDEGRLVILLNAFIKKTGKIPRREIDKAETLQRKYFSQRRT
jgi:phage-related protein